MRPSHCLSLFFFYNFSKSCVHLIRVARLWRISTQFSWQLCQLTTHKFSVQRSWPLQPSAAFFSSAFWCGVRVTPRIAFSAAASCQQAKTLQLAGWLARSAVLAGCRRLRWLAAESAAWAAAGLLQLLPVEAMPGEFGDTGVRSAVGGGRSIPFTVTSTFLDPARSRCSQSHTPCHVPRFSFPSVTGTVRLDPRKQAFTWAG